MNVSVVENNYSFEIRIHPNGEYGSEYSWCCLAVPIDVETVEIRLTTKSPTWEEIKSLKKKLLEIGYKYVCWERRKHNSKSKKKFKF